ncbi:MAG: TatD family hydrolase [Lentisphaeria bacterium]|nr:TatD family hydrolase [Lentisphaeria bacterium]
MDLFDTHAHLTENDIDPAAYNRLAADAGVTRVLFCSSGLENSRKSADFAAACPDFFFAAGVHPHEAQEMQEGAGAYKIFAECPRLIAIGELGLDYYYDISPRDRQIAVFRDFLKLALEMDLPAVVHCRDKDPVDNAYADCYDILKDYSAAGGKFVLHSYAGTVEWMKRFADLGAWSGVGGMLTFKRADNIRQVVAEMPREKIILETDSPYLAPVPHRGKTNHPSFLPFTAQALANLTEQTTDAVSAMTTANALALFRRISPC